MLKQNTPSKNALPAGGKSLARPEELIPGQKLKQQLNKGYQKTGSGKPPYPLEIMLRIHIMQLVYNLSDPEMEDYLYEVESMRRFAPLRLCESIPDETTILNFRHYTEAHKFGKKIFETINQHVADKGLKLREGTKNADGERDLEMHQIKKGNEWHHRMKMHIGIDDGLGLIHCIATTAANEHHITQTEKLLHGDKQQAWGYAGYLGVNKREEHMARAVDWFIAMRPVSGQSGSSQIHWRKQNKLKLACAQKMSIPFLHQARVSLQQNFLSRFGKNTHRLYVLAGLANLLRMKSCLLP